MVVLSRFEVNIGFSALLTLHSRVIILWGYPHSFVAVSDVQVGGPFFNLIFWNGCIIIFWVKHHFLTPLSPHGWVMIWWVYSQFFVAISDVRGAGSFCSLVFSTWLCLTFWAECCFFHSTHSAQSCYCIIRLPARFCSHRWHSCSTLFSQFDFLTRLCYSVLKWKCHFFCSALPTQTCYYILCLPAHFCGFR